MRSTAVITSRTVLASAVLTTIALFGIISPDAIPQSQAARIVIGAVIVLCFIGIVYFRVTAKVPVRPGSDDKTLAALLIVPLLLTTMFTQGCISADTAQETWGKLSPAQKTLVIADSLQKGFMRVKELYGDVYQVVPQDTKDKMAENLAPRINKAQPIIEAFVAAAVAWSESGIEPDNIDMLKADAQAAYGAVSADVQTLVTAVEAAGK